MWIINILGIALIIAIVWWFWLYNPKETKVAQGVITVLVENGIYQPARIKLPANKEAIIRFQRKDASPCAGTVVFPDFDISEDLPLDKIKDVRIPATKPGKYAFTCQMQMYRGDLILED